MSEQARQLEHLVADFIESENLITAEELVLVAVSGGRDSMALLSILHALSRTRGYTLAVAHLDHMLREDSGRDAAAVEAFAKKLELPCYTAQVDVRSLTADSNDTLEEAGRKARYRFLTDTARSIGAGRIATGHTSDDQVETVLMRILRGTGIRGLAGIPAKRGPLIRPLIHLSRNDIDLYVRTGNISFIDDPSNSDTRFMRNRIRHDLLPLLKNSFHPGVSINLLNLCHNAQSLVAAIRQRTRPVVKRSLRPLTHATWLLDLTPLRELDETSLFMLFSDIFADHLECDMDFTRSHYDMLRSLSLDEGKSGKQISLPGVEIKREFDSLLITATAAAAEIPSENERVDLASLRLLNRGIKVPGTTTVSGVTVVAEIVRGRSVIPAALVSSGTTAYFSLDEVTPPLEIRTPTTGDRIQPFGMSGTKKLSDIFIDKKIPGRQRARSLVISDAKEIMWVVGIVSNERFRVTAGTRNILKLTVMRK